MTNVPFPFPGNTDNQVYGLGPETADDAFDLAKELASLGEIDPAAAPFLAQYEIGAQIDSVIQQPFEVLEVPFEISPAPIVNASPIEQPVVSPVVEEPAAPVVSPTVDETPAAPAAEEPAAPATEEPAPAAPKAATRATTKAAPKA